MKNASYCITLIALIMLVSRNVYSDTDPVKINNEGKDYKIHVEMKVYQKQESNLMALDSEKELPRNRRLYFIVSVIMTVNSNEHELKTKTFYQTTRFMPGGPDVQRLYDIKSTNVQKNNVFIVYGRGGFLYIDHFRFDGLYWFNIATLPLMKDDGMGFSAVETLINQDNILEIKTPGSGPTIFYDIEKYILTSVSDE